MAWGCGLFKNHIKILSNFIQFYHSLYKVVNTKEKSETVSDAVWSHSGPGVDGGSWMYQIGSERWEKDASSMVDGGLDTQKIRSMTDSLVDQQLDRCKVQVQSVSDQHKVLVRSYD